MSTKNRKCVRCPNPARAGKKTCSKKCEAKYKRDLQVKRTREFNKKLTPYDENIIIPDEKIERFMYSKKIKEYEKIADKRREGKSKLHKFRWARKQTNDYIDNMDDDNPMKELYKIEREYVRTFEKEVLRANIRKKLNTEKVSGTYTLRDAGFVICVSRERARQYEESVLRAIKQPSFIGIFREYLREED